MSGARSNRSLAARRGRPYDKGRGFVAQALWVAVSTLIFTQVWCPNRLRCALSALVRRRHRQGVLIRHRVRVQWPWKLSIGDNSWIGTGRELYNIDDIVIGSDVCISQHVYLCTGSHDRRSPTFEFDNGPIVIEDGVWMCARSTVLRGVTIGANSVVGATSLVSPRRSSRTPSFGPPSRPSARSDGMRILQVVTLLSPDGAYGGPARVALNQSAELISRGHDVTVVAATRGYRVTPTELNGGAGQVVCRSDPCFPEPASPAWAHPGSAKWFRSNGAGFDVVHIHFGRDLVVLPVAVAARRHRIPYVLQTHGMVVPSNHPLAGPLDAVWTRKVLRDAGAVFYLTPQEREQLGAVAGAAPLRLVPARQRCAATTRAAGRPPGPPEVLFVARMHPRKRPLAFVEMAKALLDEGVDARFTLVGPDEGEGAALRAALKGDPRISWEGALTPTAIPRAHGCSERLRAPVGP